MKVPIDKKAILDGWASEQGARRRGMRIVACVLSGTQAVEADMASITSK
jgi:hypothetical protein